MEMTKEQAQKWLKDAKQNKKDTVERMKKVLADEYEKGTGMKANYIEVL